MEIYFVRHGLTKVNLEHRFQGGRVNAPLLASGVEGAKAAGQFLSKTHFDMAVASPQLRAQETAENVLAPNVNAPQLTLDPRFKEMDFGDWDGVAEKDVNQTSAFQLFMHHPDQYDPSQAGGGENYAEFVQRTTGALHDYVARLKPQSDAKLLLVSHGLVTTLTIKTLLGTPMAKLRDPLYINGKLMPTIGYGIVDNNSVTVVETTDNQEFKVLDWNDTSFLNDAKN